MGLKEASSGGGILRQLAGEDASTKPDRGTLVIVRIVEYTDPDDCEVGDYSWDLPVTVDVLEVQQDDMGEVIGYQVHLDDPVRFALANSLRGHASVAKDVKRRDLPRPADPVGEETIGRVQLVTGKKGGRPFVALNAPSTADSKRARKLREELGGEEWGRNGKPLSGGQVLASVGAGAADDEPPF